MRSWGQGRAVPRSGGLARVGLVVSAVVLIDVLGEDRLDVASTEDQEVVQAVFSDGANPAFGKRVRPWGADRRLDGLDADRGEYSVERRGEEV